MLGFWIVQDFGLFRILDCAWIVKVRFWIAVGLFRTVEVRFRIVQDRRFRISLDRAGFYRIVESFLLGSARILATFSNPGSGSHRSLE